MDSLCRHGWVFGKAQGGEKSSKSHVFKYTFGSLHANAILSHPLWYLEKERCKWDKGCCCSSYEWQLCQMATLDEPIGIHLFWDCEVRRSLYFVGHSKKTWLIKRQISHAELVNKICTFRGFDRSSVALTFLFRCPVLIPGCTTAQYYIIGLNDDDDMDNLWSLPPALKAAGVCIYV